MSSFLQPHANDCEQDHSSKEFESTFEVEATKAVENDKVEGIFLTWEDLWDPEKGLSGGLSTEEAILILVKSYDLSEISHQVQKELSQIKKRARGSLLVFVVTFLTFITVCGFPSFVEDMKSFEKVKPIVAAINCPQENFRFTKVTRSSEIV
ncbi:hypothetical protein TSUD_83540 [Trifolium subterraneum]|uniref:Uncharacterized protein n=1 Tax=Trifolium subterraneum TaxID=3900 RepID=A0A2Z6PMP5_TRISU|nr:hypothetical protein TSUD_83540 [Trifolium subterraneum]